jgi:peptidyl-prolyl cis-trans isomerase C
LLGLGCLRGPPEGTAAVIATVNGEAVPALVLKQELARERHESQGLGPRTAEELDAARKLDLQRLIERTELLQEARKVGISASEDEVEKALLALRADYPGTSFDELLADEEISPADLRARLGEQVTIRKLLSRQLAGKTVPTEAELQHAYETAKDLDRPEQVRAKQIVVKTEEEAQALQQSLKQGQSFEELARKHSLSPDAKQGGDLGWFERGAMPPIFAQVCFALPEGKVSDVVASSYGFQLFKVIGRRPARHASFQEIRPELMQRLTHEKLAAAEEAYLADLRTRSVVTIDEKAVERVH